MARIETLPERLQYLRPFQEYLATLPAAEVGESTDSTVLEKLLRKRIKGMSSKEAKDQLTADLEELEKHPARRRDVRLGFILGYLLIAAEMPDELLKPQVKPKKIVERLTMELPPGAKSSVDEYSLTVKWKRQTFHALVCNMEDEFSREWTLAKLAHPNASEYELLNLVGNPGAAGIALPKVTPIRPQAIDVSLGKVDGHKRVDFSNAPFVWKKVEYLLRIPGGYVTVCIQAGHLFDDSEWDSYLATLHFIKLPRSKAKSPATARRTAL
jgi:hypothetical protein